ncbi:hypothetical protein BIV25_45025 [Streptomyces sp. MUSC 14]|uniref:hypothetical protein n=1 Tax=Streptomyces sp. MUSC 14 TaxID=1354889 RepID=UPI0008F5D1C9|nr:hypothetical protein [Streptomyces sp. MUSC 14]OIJ85070.1 hypothetical protein BIV25_45025 [Streptomyces sp. MUSC 14]
MTVFSIDNETDGVRRAILAAMNRLFAGTPQRSNGRLNVSQLAIEADVKRWHLTHQHPDLKDLFQAQAAEEEEKRASHVRSADAHEELKKKHSDLQAHCRFLEERLQIYATALNLLSLEHAALSGRDAEAAKVRILPRQPRHLP